MSMRERWRSLPWDVKLGYVTFLGFSLWVCLLVVGGPNLALFLISCFVYPAIVAVLLVILVRLCTFHRNWSRVLPLLLLVSSISTCLLEPVSTWVDLHLMFRVYLAGGPNTVNNWAQRMIQEQIESGTHSTRLTGDQVPMSIREGLGGWASVGGAIWSDDVRLRIELGGGFYHYGIVVFPTAQAPEPEWWQRILGWPPELVVYHEN